MNLDPDLIEEDCSLGKFKSAKLKDKECTINVTIGSLERSLGWIRTAVIAMSRLVLNIAEQK